MKQQGPALAHPSLWRALQIISRAFSTTCEASRADAPGEALILPFHPSNKSAFSGPGGLRYCVTDRSVQRRTTKVVRPTEDTMQTEVYLYSRRSAPPALLRRCTAAWIALVAPDVTLAERAELRSRGVAVFDLAPAAPQPGLPFLSRRAVTA